MKKLQLILNVVFGIGIVALFVLYFVKGENNAEATSSSGEFTNVLSSVPAGSIVYVDLDSLLSNYDMYFDFQREFDQKYKTSEAEYADKLKQVQKEYQDLQYKWDKGLITRSEAAEMEGNLQKEQQKLMQLENSLKTRLAEEEQVMLAKVLHSENQFLESQKAQYKYQYVLGTRFGDQVLYANDSLNITNSVLKGLNQAYTKNKSK